MQVFRSRAGPYILIVFREELAEVANRDRDNRDGYQPVGVVNGGRCASSTRGAVRFYAQSYASWGGDGGLSDGSVRNELSGAAELDGILDHLGWKAVAVI